MGYHAVALLDKGIYNRVVAVSGDKIVDYDVNVALSMHKIHRHGYGPRSPTPSPSDHGPASGAARHNKTKSRTGGVETPFPVAALVGFCFCVFCSVQTVQGVEHVPVQTLQGVLHHMGGHGQVHADAARTVEGPAVLPDHAHPYAGFQQFVQRFAVGPAPVGAVQKQHVGAFRLCQLHAGQNGRGCTPPPGARFPPSTWRSSSSQAAPVSE